MHCLWCDEEMSAHINWSNLFIPDAPTSLCNSCEAKLEKITGKQCKLCGRILKEDMICGDCKRWDRDPIWKGVLSFNRSAFIYNQMMQEVITKWKYRGDYMLCEVFRDAFCKQFNQVFGQISKEAIAVPIPLSDERLNERAFNQAEALANLLDFPYQQLLTRIHGEKQSKKTRRDRLATTNPFAIKTVSNKPVILIDDIYTTGITLRHAAKLLKKSGCPKVYSYTLARG